MSRRENLRQYFLEVTRDLVTRGAIKRARGQSLEEVLRTELPVVLQEVQADVLAIAKEMGQGFAKSLISVGMQWLAGGRR